MEGIQLVIHLYFNLILSFDDSSDKGLLAQDNEISCIEISLS